MVASTPNRYGDRIHFYIDEIDSLIKNHLNIDTSKLDAQARDKLIIEIVDSLFNNEQLWIFLSFEVGELLKAHGVDHIAFNEFINYIAIFYSQQYYYIKQVMEKLSYDYTCNVEIELLSKNVALISIYLTDEFYPFLLDLDKAVSKSIDENKHVPGKYLKILGRI